MAKKIAKAILQETEGAGTDSVFEHTKKTAKSLGISSKNLNRWIHAKAKAKNIIQE